jgi:hypothetical protein
MLDAVVSPGLQGPTDGTARQATAAQQQLEGTASFVTERWCFLVALAGGAAGEEHGGIRGGRRAKCDEEKAKVKFALTMEAAQGILTVRKPWARVHVGEKVGGGRSKTVGTAAVCGRRRRQMQFNRMGWYRSNGPDPFTLFLLFTSFLINSKARVSKIQITFLLNSKNFKLWQVDG